VVTDEDGELCGVYGSVNRACAYTLDWLSAAFKDDPEWNSGMAPYKFDNELTGSGPWNFNGYLIRESTLRK
jgi:hypothetical protein